MSRPKNIKMDKLFHKKDTYVITPTYKTEDELDKAVDKLYSYAKHFHRDMHLPQRTYLKILGVRQPVGSREYRNDVLLDTGTKHNVKDDKGEILYWYMRFDVISTKRNIGDKPFEHGVDLNSYTG